MQGFFWFLTQILFLFRFLTPDSTMSNFLIYFWLKIQRFLILCNIFDSFATPDSNASLVSQEIAREAREENFGVLFEPLMFGKSCRKNKNVTYFFWVFDSGSNSLTFYFWLAKNQKKIIKALHCKILSYTHSLISDSESKVFDIFWLAKVKK